jgi:ankyrin repeat protein
VNTKGGHGSNPLQAACYAGHTEMVQLLIRNGADVNIKDSHGWDSLTNVLAGGHTKVIDLLPDYRKLSAITGSSALLGPSALVHEVRSSGIVISENHRTIIAG